MFFIALFWIVNLAFGSTYTMLVSSYTALFNMRWRKYNSPASYAHIFALSLALLALARLAVANLALCVALNLAVPLVLVFMRSSQLNPRRHFAYLMLFVFLELRPEIFDRPLELVAIVLASCAATCAGLALCGLARREADKSVLQLHASIRRLAAALDRIADQGVDHRTGEELLAIKNELSAHAYMANEDSAAPDTLANLFEMFAALAQRTAYLVGNLDWATSGTEEAKENVRALAEITRAVDAELNLRGNRALIGRIEGLLAQEDELDQSRFRIFYRGYLHMLRCALQEATERGHRSWHLSTANQLRIAAFRKRPSLDSFELRFSVRCGVVLAVSCAVNMLFPVDHLYWFTMHAFLLMQPYPAESLHRIRTRAVGTVGGCVLVHALSLLALPYEAVMALGMVFTAFMYTAKPGSVTMAFFATAYAVALASFSIGDRYATVMRIVCLAFAIALVFLVDRMVCPTSQAVLFRANVRLMLGMFERSWALVRKSLREAIEPAVTVEALLHFQMVHLQACDFAKTIDDPRERAAVERALFYMWELACELEQLELLVRIDDLDEDEKRLIDRFAEVAEGHCSPFRFTPAMEELAPVAQGVRHDDVRYVLGQYLHQSIHLADALDEAPDEMIERPAYLDEVKSAV